MQLGRLQDAADELRIVLAKFPDDRQARQGYSEVLRQQSLSAHPAGATGPP
jgi:hypothetical protein